MNQKMIPNEFKNRQVWVMKPYNGKEIMYLLVLSDWINEYLYDYDKESIKSFFCKHSSGFQIFSFISISDI